MLALVEARGLYRYTGNGIFCEFPSTNLINDAVHLHFISEVHKTTSEAVKSRAILLLRFVPMWATYKDIPSICYTHS